MFPNECPSALLGQLTNPRGFKATLGDRLRLWLPIVDKMGGVCEASADTADLPNGWWKIQCNDYVRCTYSGFEIETCEMSLVIHFFHHQFV